MANEIYMKFTNRSSLYIKPDFENFSEGIKALFDQITNCEPIKENVKRESDTYFNNVIKKDSYPNDNEKMLLVLKQSLNNLGTQLYLSFSQDKSTTAETHANILFGGALGFDVFTLSFKKSIFHEKSLDGSKLDQYAKQYMYDIYNIGSDCVVTLNINNTELLVNFSINCKNHKSFDKNKFNLDRQNKWSKYIESFETHPILQECMLQPHLFDPRYNIKYIDPTSWDCFIKERRGNEPYYIPLGWERFALNIEYFGWYIDDEWIGCKNTENEWSVAFHGIGRMGNQLEILKKIITDPSGKPKMIPGTDENSQDMNEQKDINKRSDRYGTPCGNGVYFTPFIEYASYYAAPVLIKGKLYQVALQCRLNPKKIRKPEGRLYEYVINNTSDIRPYGILIKEYDQNSFEDDVKQVDKFLIHLKKHPRET